MLEDIKPQLGELKTKLDQMGESLEQKFQDRSAKRVHSECSMPLMFLQKTEPVLFT